MFILKTIIKAIILPPGIIIILAVAGLVLIQRQKKSQRKYGLLLMVAATVLLSGFSVPVFNKLITSNTASYTPIDFHHIPNAGAIVVLTGGMNRNSPEYGSDMANPASVSRARYAAFLYKHSAIPIMVIGGKPQASTLSEADVTRRFLKNELNTPVRWIEEEAKDTAESAVNSFRILSQQNISSILLVSHSYHMARAELLFAQAGFKVFPAAIDFAPERTFSAYDLLPSAGTFSASSRDLKEWLGAIWGRIKNASKHI